METYEQCIRDYLQRLLNETATREEAAETAGISVSYLKALITKHLPSAKRQYAKHRGQWDRPIPEDA